MTTSLNDRESKSEPMVKCRKDLIPPRTRMRVMFGYIHVDQPNSWSINTPKSVKNKNKKLYSRINKVNGNNPLVE